MSTDEHNLSDDLGMFEAAVHSKPVELTSPECHSIVTLLDGSNQDQTVQGLARAIVGPDSHAEVHETTQPEADAKQVKQICDENKADLLILPVPFGRDIDVLKDESLGSVVDMILQDLTIPVLCVRQPLDEEQQAAVLGDVLIPVVAKGVGDARALSWGFRMVVREGELELIGVADQDVIDEAKQLLNLEDEAEEIQDDALMRAVTRDLGDLVSSAQKKGLEQSVSVKVEVKVGSPVDVVLEQANERSRLLITSVSRDHKSVSFHQMRDLILGANGPVLVV